MRKLSFKSNEFDGVKINPLINTPFIKEVQILMEKGSMMKEHKAPGAIIVQVLKGEIEFGVNDEIINLNKLELVTLEPNIVHFLKAKEDSIVRLSLSKNDNVSRVFGVLDL
ncbi:MAG: AraC family ligand binding domain-containing protein [Campylobacter sp.]|nr:AraC family ligand binding domain-containing protein [Campylobacter sp.]